MEHEATTVGLLGLLGLLAVAGRAAGGQRGQGGRGRAEVCSRQPAPLRLGAGAKCLGKAGHRSSFGLLPSRVEPLSISLVALDHLLTGIRQPACLRRWPPCLLPVFCLFGLPSVAPHLQCSGRALS